MPRLSAGATFGLLAGYLPVRYGVSYGGTEGLGSAVGIGMDTKGFSMDAFYKAMGSPALIPSRGFEVGGGITVSWNFKRRRTMIRDTPHDKAKSTLEAALAVDTDSVPEPDTPFVWDFFTYDDSTDVVYAPLYNMVMPPQDESDWPQGESQSGSTYGYNKYGLRYGQYGPKLEPWEEPWSEDWSEAYSDTLTEPTAEFQPQALPQITEEEAMEFAASQRGINFLPGSATLTESSYAPLEIIVSLITQYPGIRYEIQGHADGHGEEVYNLLLSAERAAVVKKHLMSRGVPESNLVAVGYGRNMPLAGNNTAVGRALNRRVEFVQILTQAHFNWVKRFELEMIPRLTKRVLHGKPMMENKPMLETKKLGE
jgi:outer membrane protein OmpA-like peptidoglycan-associated protein